METKTYYKTISKSKLACLYRAATTVIAGSEHGNTEIDYILSCYTPANAIAGCTDYKDHRKDTVPQIKRMIRKDIETRQCQIGSYYDINGVPFDTVLVYLRNGSWSAYPAWKNGNSDYFTERRNLAALKYKR